MGWHILLLVIAALAAFATPQSVSLPAPPLSSDEPCAAIRPLIQNSIEAVPQIPAKVAWKCLLSVPLNATAAVEWLDSLKPYLEWQTTTVFLKNPRPEFDIAPQDLFGELDRMIANVGSYVNEWAFEFDLYRLFQRSGDGHLRYLPTLIGGVVLFGRPLAVVSVSPDGHSIPQPYVYSDILQAAIDPSFEPSPLTTINGDEAVTYLTRLSQYGSAQDQDAQYNDVMYNIAQISLGDYGNGAGIFAGGGRGGMIYPNATTEVSFENGTSRSYQNFARVLQDFKGISTGQDVFDQYLIRYPNRTSSSWNGVPKQLPAPGYPIPITGQQNNYIRGFYLDGPGYEDVAVLTVGKFLGEDFDDQAFQQMALTFLNRSQAEGKSRLIVDLRADGGGTILNSYNLFLNLFPDLFPYGANRFRAHEAFNIIGQVVSDAAGPIYPWNISNAPGPTRSLTNYLGTPFPYKADVDIDYQNFNSWQEKYGPHALDGDNFTSVMRWNLSDPTQRYVNGFTVNGFQDRVGIVPDRPFLAENIVLLYDGFCASSCAIFSEFMIQQGGVKTVAVGGRPAYAPMQTVGGTRGTNNWPFRTINTFVSQAFSLIPPEQQAAYEVTELGNYTMLPFLRSADNSGSVNVRDGIRQGDTTQTPLQFARYLADCRIWFEPAFTLDTNPLWRRVVDVAWGGASCVAGTSSGMEKREGEVVRGTRHQPRAMAKAELRELRAGVDLFTNFRLVKLTGDAEMLP